MSPEAYARALQHQEAAARDYEAAAMIYGSPCEGSRVRRSYCNINGSSAIADIGPCDARIYKGSEIRWRLRWSG